MGDGQNSQDNRSRHDYETQRDPQPIDYCPEANDTVTEALTSRTHSPFFISRTPSNRSTQ